MPEAPTLDLMFGADIAISSSRIHNGRSILFPVSLPNSSPPFSFMEKPMALVPTSSVDGKALSSFQALGPSVLCSRISSFWSLASTKYLSPNCAAIEVAIFHSLKFSILHHTYLPFEAFEANLGPFVLSSSTCLVISSASKSGWSVVGSILNSSMPAPFSIRCRSFASSSLPWNGRYSSNAATTASILSARSANSVFSLSISNRLWADFSGISRQELIWSSVRFNLSRSFSAFSYFSTNSSSVSWLTTSAQFEYFLTYSPSISTCSLESVNSFSESASSFTSSMLQSATFSFTSFGSRPSDDISFSEVSSSERSSSLLFRRSLRSS